VLAYDNLSGLSGELSDLLCCVATGGGFSKRQLYTDGDEVTFDFMRPVTLNGIDELLSRPDLTDRALRVALPVIPTENRRSEKDVWAAFEISRPRILGALCSAVSSALASLAEVESRKEPWPRMMDFAQWAEAAGSGLGWSPGAFLASYQGNRGDLVGESLAADPVATALVAVLSRCPDWKGTAGSLLAELTRIAPVPRAKSWPENERALTDRLRRLAPQLRSTGIQWLPPGRTDKRRIHSFQPTAQTAHNLESEKEPLTAGANGSIGSSANDWRTKSDDDRESVGAEGGLGGHLQMHPRGCRCAGDDCALGGELRAGS